MRFELPASQGTSSSALDPQGFVPRPADLGQRTELAPKADFGLTALLTDGPTVVFLSIAFIVVHIGTVLRREARWMPWALAVLVLAGAGVRWVMAPETVMNAWPYERVVPLARSVFEGPTLTALLSTRARGVYLTDVIFWTTFLVSALTPLVVFAHARYVLRSATAALAVTAVFCFLPHHIRFSRSDVEYVQSLATSSLTFVLIYTALLGESKAWRWATACLVPLLTLATYRVRPENMFFAVVDLGAILFIARRGVPVARRVVVAIAIAAPAVYSFFGHLWTHYSAQVAAGFESRTIRNAGELAIDPELNTLINPAVTPPLLLVAVALGVWSELSRREYQRLAYLCIWLVGFFCIHSFVRPSVVAMQARYHLHLVTPFLLLAGLAVPELARGPRWRTLLIAGYVASMPLLHRDFITDVGYSEMQEFDFLRRHREHLFDCDVIEYAPVTPGLPVAVSRLRRIGTRLSRNGLERPRVIDSANLAVQDRPRSLLSATQGVAAESRCLLAFEGLTCHTQRDRVGEVAEACAAVRAHSTGEPGIESELTVGIYDEIKSGRQIVDEFGNSVVAPVLSNGERLRLRLYRVDPTFRAE